MLFGIVQYISTTCNGSKNPWNRHRRQKKESSTAQRVMLLLNIFQPLLPLCLHLCCKGTRNLQNPRKNGKSSHFSFPYKEYPKNYFLLLSRDMNLKSAICRILMSRNRIFHRMTTTFSVGAVLFWSNSDLTLGEWEHNDGHTPTACTTHHNYDLISVSIPNVHLDQCCLTSAVVYVISGFSGPRIQIIDTMYPCAIGPIGQMVMVHQPLLLNQTVHKFVKVTLFHVTMTFNIRHF